jgi:hypothetical protein
MVLSRQGYCQRCNGDLRLYAAVRWLPELLFNDARALAEKGDDGPAMDLLSRALSLRTEFPEARLLMSFLEARKPAVSADASAVPLPMPQHGRGAGGDAAANTTAEIENCVSDGLLDA